MANIIRCVLPNGVVRFKPFTIADYRDFLLVRNDMTHKTIEEQQESVKELIDDYFSEYPETMREYIFLKVFTGSTGKVKIPVAFECPVCGKQKTILFDMTQADLKHPTAECNGIGINFKFPEKYYKDQAEQLCDNIVSIKYNGKQYPWEDLSEGTQLQVIEAIDIPTLDDVIKQMTPIQIKLRMHCCEKNELIYDNMLQIFKLLINPDEIFTFYQINHLLVKSNYDLDAIMNMIPVERSIALSLVEKDNKK